MLSMKASVVLPLAFKDELTYLVPKALVSRVRIGQRVLVGLGKRNTYVGVITKLFSDNSSENKEEFELKSLLFLLDDRPIVTEEEIQFWQFLAYYYIVPLGDILTVALPRAMLPRGTTIVSIHYEQLKSISNWDKKEEKWIEKLRQYGEKSLSFETFIKLLGKSSTPFFDKLYSIGILEDETSEKFTTKAIGVESLVLGETFRSFEKLNELVNSLKRAPRQKECLLTFLSLLPLDKDENPKLDSSIPIKAIYEDSTEKRNALRQLRIKYPLLFEVTFEAKSINTQTLQSIDTIEDIPPCISLDNTKPTLFLAQEDKEQYTFLSAQIKNTLAEGKRVLLLLPQSSSIEGDEVFIRPLLDLKDIPITFLSGQSTQKERMELRKTLIERDEPLLIVGSRLATFIPSNGLGLIIIAEEQDPYYKQQEPSPRFHARDSLIFRAHSLQIPILLTTVTPSLETLINVQNKKYHLLTSTHLLNTPPQIECIDILKERKINRLKRDNLLTKKLRDEITHCLSAHKKVLILAARKGFAPFLSCSQCGEAIRCSRCAVTLTYHHYKEQLVCPYCGLTLSVPKVCPHCIVYGEARGGTLRKVGFGTERIESELSIHFQKKSLIRIDAETTRLQRDRKTIKETFRAGEGDIYIGTTLISRLISFQNIGLIAIPQFDLLTSYPDFRTDEQLYNLILRLIRRFPKAKLLFQLSDLNHPLIKRLETNHPQEVYQELLMEREFFKFPPYQRLIRLIIKGKNRQEVEQVSLLFTKAFSLEKEIFAEVDPPIEPFVSRVKLLYIRHITLRLNPKVSSKLVRLRIKETKEHLYNNYPLCRKMNYFFDVDPY